MAINGEDQARIWPVIMPGSVTILISINTSTAGINTKDDSVHHPTLSYKDRVVSVAATRAMELGFPILACASTGNLANSVAAHAARLGVECCVFIPDNLEAGKLLGSAIFNPTILAIAGT